MVPQDIIYTLSSAVETLDEQISNRQASQQEQSGAQKAAIVKALLQGNHDGHDVRSQGQQIQGQLKQLIQDLHRFRPFNVPPVPVPFKEFEQSPESDAAAAESEANEEMQARHLEISIQQEGSDPYIQQVVLNVPQSAEDRGFFTSHGSPSTRVDEAASIEEIDDVNPGRTFTRRRFGYNDGRARYQDMFAISVKRQRRLKMKKHKFKKLTRRTRNLRQRQGKV
jgi:hypothetical protein